MANPKLSPAGAHMATANNAVEATEIITHNLKDRYRQCLFLGQGMNRKYRTPTDVIICLREHLPESHEDDGATGFEVGILGPNGYSSVLLCPDRTPWEGIKTQLKEDGVSVQNWSREPIPPNVIEAFQIENPQQVTHWPVVVY